MSPPILTSRGHIHDPVVDEHRIHRVDRDRLAGTEQYYSAAVKTNLKLGVINDPVMAVIRSPRLLDLQLIGLRVCILQYCSQASDTRNQESKNQQEKRDFFIGDSTISSPNGKMPSNKIVAAMARKSPCRSSSLRHPGQRFGQRRPGDS
jgi:hypothetical protein